MYVNDDHTETNQTEADIRECEIEKVGLVWVS